MADRGRKLRVAYLGIKGLPARGGAERVVEAIVKRMPAKGIEPVVYCGADYTPDDTRIDGVKLIRLPTVRGKHRRQMLLNIASAMHSLFLGDYDIVHLHHAEASFVLPILRVRYRVICTSHGSAYRTRKWGPAARTLMRLMDWPLMHLSSMVTFVSAVDADRFRAKYGREVVHIPNGASTDIIPDKAGARQMLDQHGLEPGRYAVFVAGRIEPIKGAHLAIEAVNKLECDDRLLVVGDLDQVASYGEQLRAKASDRVVFIPPITDAALLFGLMTEARLLVFPSTVEAMSMVLLEAASLGVPVICSDIPENVAVMKNDAVYFESGNAESLTEKLRWSLQDEDGLKALAESARTRVLRENSWDAVADRYAEAYARVLEGSKCAC